MILAYYERWRKSTSPIVLREHRVSDAAHINDVLASCRELGFDEWSDSREEVSVRKIRFARPVTNEEVDAVPIRALLGFSRRPELAPSAGRH